MRRLAEIGEELGQLSAVDLDEPGIAAALAQFDGVWEALSPREQAKILELLVERVDYDGVAGNVAITLHPTVIKSLGSALEAPEECVA